MADHQHFLYIIGPMDDLSDTAMYSLNPSTRAGDGQRVFRYCVADNTGNAFTLVRLARNLAVLPLLHFINP
ncbi:MAG: hypothetical protein ACOC2H_01955 [Spirochaetota bacterium]